MTTEHKVKVDNPEPETEPVTFYDITLNCGRVLEMTVKPKQGDSMLVLDESNDEKRYFFVFPKFHLTQTVWCRQIAAESVRESVIVILPPKKEKA